MGVRRGELPEAVYELSNDQVERWRDGDMTAWAERTPGLLDRPTRPGVRVTRDPGRLVEVAAREVGFEAEAG